MIFARDGSPAAPTYVVDGLKRIHPSLDLQYLAFPDPQGNTAAWWALVERWGDNDPRLEKVKKGELADGSAYDILGFLPLDCTADQAYGYVLNALRSNNTEQFSKHLNRIDKFNKDVVKKVKEEVHEMAEEIVKANSKTLMGNDSPVKVYQSSKGKK